MGLLLIIRIIDDIPRCGVAGAHKVRTGVIKPATVNDMSVTPYCAVVRK